MISREFVKSVNKNGKALIMALPQQRSERDNALE